MKNPYNVLKIDNELTIEQEVENLRKKLQEIENLNRIYETFKPSMIGNQIDEFKIGGENIEEILNERHILGFVKDKKYFSKKEFEKILDMFEEKKEKSSNYYTKTRILQCSIAKQVKSLRKDLNKYKSVLQNYQNAPHNQQNIQAIHDMYIKDKFEEEVIGLAKRISISPPEKIEKNSEFLDVLTNNLEYKNLLNAYNQIATAKLREDRIPQNYVRNRNIDDSQLFVVDDKHIDKLLERESEYVKQWQENQNKTSSEKYKEGIAENSNHDYAWGIVLEKPVSCMKNEMIDTPIFKGKMSVERIGYFSSQSLFNKRKFEREKKSKYCSKRTQKIIFK